MKDTHADRMLRAAKALRSSLFIVIQHVDTLCAMIEASSVPELGSRVPGTAAPWGNQEDPPLRVDRDTLTVSWAGAECFLGYTLPFRLLERMAQRPNQFLRSDRLMDEIWEGTRAPSTVRSAVSQLRTKLAAAGMGDLAELIDGSNPGHYGLMLSRHESKSDGNRTAVKHQSDGPL